MEKAFRTGFFDLPLELRQQIYLDVLQSDPKGRPPHVFLSPPYWAAHRALRSADLRIAFELSIEERRLAQSLSFWVMDNEEWTAPEPCLMRQLAWVGIDFEPFDHEDEDRREERLDKMARNLRRFVGWFVDGGNTTEELNVSFEAYETEQNACWITFCPRKYEGMPTTTRLAMREGPRSMPVVESLLLPLEHFPVTPCVEISRLDGLSTSRRLREYADIGRFERKFDCRYMDVLFEAWEYWLRDRVGDRAGCKSWREAFKARRRDRISRQK